jgi:putative membrane protein
MMDGFGHGWGMGWGWIIGVFIILAVVWLIIKAINSNKHRGGTPEKSALDILKDRYARGEIDRKEFEEKKKDLLS